MSTSSLHFSHDITSQRTVVPCSALKRASGSRLMGVPVGDDKMPWLAKVCIAVISSSQENFPWRGLNLTSDLKGTAKIPAGPKYPWGQSLASKYSWWPHGVGRRWEVRGNEALTQTYQTLHGVSHVRRVTGRSWSLNSAAETTWSDQRRPDADHSAKVLHGKSPYTCFFLQHIPVKIIIQTDFRPGFCDVSFHSEPSGALLLSAHLFIWF